MGRSYPYLRAVATARVNGSGRQVTTVPATAAAGRALGLVVVAVGRGGLGRQLARPAQPAQAAQPAAQLLNLPAGDRETGVSKFSSSNRRNCTTSHVIDILYLNHLPIPVGREEIFYNACP